ncbi:hypothetical protein, partial [Candidatus Magnetaquicoccus inordinatus]|uniref:hypothetical protein n=1 Tax=Candidatus Magnetaquicoccus inordinatus TaxID=2496818 RepID=UPI001D0F1C8E
LARIFCANAHSIPIGVELASQHEPEQSLWLYQKGREWPPSPDQAVRLPIPLLVSRDEQTLWQISTHPSWST